MILRRCPKCGERHYNADTRDVNWECRNCDQEIPKEQEGDESEKMLKGGG